MDDETSERKAAHRPNAPVTKPELVSYDVADRLSSRCDAANIGCIIFVCNFYFYFFAKKNFLTTARRTQHHYMRIKKLVL
jgi:hypothetical protein